MKRSKENKTNLLMTLNMIFTVENYYVLEKNYVIIELLYQIIELIINII